MQQKASLSIVDGNSFCLTEKDGRYIVKPSPAEFPHAAENEHAAMLSSRLLDIPTAECGLISFEDGALAYITKRFDRVGNNKIHQEDMAQGFGLNSQEKYAKNYEEVGFKISEMTGGKKAVLLDFICRLIHAYLIGNDDFHLKNISLQRRLDNKTLFYDALTPNYDALFVQAFSNASQAHFLALDFFADDYFSDSFLHYGFYTGHDFIELGAKLGIPQKPISTVISKIETRLPKLLQIIGSSYMPEDMKKRSIHIVKDRSKGIFIRDNL